MLFGGFECSIDLAGFGLVLGGFPPPLALCLFFAFCSREPILRMTEPQHFHACVSRPQVTLE